MASRQNYFQSQIQYSTASFDRRFEFQESDIWNSDDDIGALISPSSPEPRQNAPAISASRSRNRSARKPPVSASSSLPVNVPDWSKILGAGGVQWRSGNQEEADADGSDDDDVEDRVPPHEYAARQVARRSNTVVAFSVQEGVGRTLKGRDLRRVRNAIWKQIGFED